MAALILFNKPFQVLSQFSQPDNSDKQTLANYIDIKAVYAAGRLDYDSEGLLLLTDSGQLQHEIAHPDHKAPKTYWVQVEGIPDESALAKLRDGVELKDGLTRPAQVESIEAPEVWERTPPVRFRANIPTTWLSITISEGKNRQVRRMTAAIGHPTLRLIRARIGDWSLDSLKPGEFRVIEVADPKPKATQTKKRVGQDSRNKASHRKKSPTNNRGFPAKSKSAKIPRRK